MALPSRKPSPNRKPKKKRRYNGNVFRSKRAYSFAEIADLLETHIRTVQRWRSEGLPILDDGTKPFLVMGRDVHDFLLKQSRARKRPLRPGEFFCARCQEPRNSRIEDVWVEYTQRKLGASHSQVIIHGVCAICGTRLSLFSSERKAVDWSEQAGARLKRDGGLIGNALSCSIADIQGDDSERSK